MNHCIHRLHHLQTLDNHVVYGKEVNAFNMLYVARKMKKQGGNPAFL